MYVLRVHILMWQYSFSGLMVSFQWSNELRSFGVGLVLSFSTDKHARPFAFQLRVVYGAVFGTSRSIIFRYNYKLSIT